MKTERIYLKENGQRPYVDSYVLDAIYSQDTARGAVIVVPGGGYRVTAAHEGEPIAMQFAAAGFHTFVLSYRVPPERDTDPIEDLARTVAHVRAHAEEWRIDPDRIAVCGFSAGGHLTASLGVFWDRPFLSELVGAKSEEMRPNRVILGYPVITSGEFAHRGSFEMLCGNCEERVAEMSLEKQVTEKMPPCFLWHTAEDETVPVENSLLFAAALSAHKVPFELHVFPHGVHGQGACGENIAEAYSDFGEIGTTKEIFLQNLEECRPWTELAIRWLKR